MAGDDASVGAGKRMRVSLEAAEEGEASVKKQRATNETAVDEGLLEDFEDDSDGEEEETEVHVPPDFGIECDQEYPYFKQIVLDNFMCHNRLTVDLNPHMNFVYGPNGSGKSAVLIGLSVGLGVSSRDTKRAKQLQEYIGTFRNKAVITITIHQSGERYKGNFEGGEFGADIIVERTITKGGTSSYKLMKEDRKTVLSTKKDVLNNILQFLALQPDNPVQFMQQTVSKTFLHAGNPEKYYEFFARATRLQEYHDELVKILHTRQALQIERVRSERQYKTFMESDFDQAKQAIDGLQDALKLYAEQESVGFECLWAHEREAAQELQRVQAERDALIEAVRKDEEKASKVQEEATRHDHELDTLASEIDTARTEKKDAETGMKEANKALQDAQRERADAESEAKVAEQGIKVFENKIQGLRKEIDASHREAEKRRAEKRRKSETACDVPALEAELETLKANHESKWGESQRLAEQDRSNVEALNAAKARLAHFQKGVSAANDRVRELDGSVGNQLANFGGDVAEISRVLERAPGFARRPIGPIGKYIKMKDGHMKYSDAVSGCLNWTGLQTFLVFGGQADKARCEQALRGKVQKPFRCDFANTDSFSHDKLGSNRAPCLMDVIEMDKSFSEEEQRIVMNYLVDRHKFNEIRLVSTMDDSLSVTKASPENVRLPNGVTHQVARTCYFWNPKFQTVERKMTYPGTSSFLHNVPRGVFSEDQSELRRSAAETKVRAEEELREAKQEADGRASEVKQSQQAVLQAKREAKALEGQMQALSKKVRVEKEKQRAEEDEKEEVAEESTEVFEKEIEETRGKLRAMQEKKEEWEEEVRKRQAALASAKEVREERLACFNAKAKTAEALAAKVAAFAEDKQKAKDKAEVLQEKIAKKRRELEEKEADVGEKQADYDGCLELAVEESPDGKRIETTKTSKSLTNKYNEMKHKIERIEKQLGVTKEVATVTWEKAQATEKKLSKRTAGLVALEESVAKGIRKRRSKYKQVLRTRKRNATWEFDKFIGQRDFQGRLIFAENDKKVHRMEPHVATQKNSDGDWEEAKTVKELSGGERSFSTLCMVLSLSKVSGSPFLAMDEFDVFMDETNRTVGLKMLVHVLQKKRDCQTIVISPLSMAAVPESPDISKIKMNAIDRNQSTLV